MKRFKDLNNGDLFGDGFGFIFRKLNSRYAVCRLDFVKHLVQPEHVVVPLREDPITELKPTHIRYVYKIYDHKTREFDLVSI